METTVDKLEAMFLKSEADLEYIEKRLKLDFINNTAENGGPPEENPAVMLENLRVIKAKHTALCSQVKDITTAQKDCMDSIKNNLGSVMELIQHFQQTIDVELHYAIRSEHLEAQYLNRAVCDQVAQPGLREAQSSRACKVRVGPVDEKNFIHLVDQGAEICQVNRREWSPGSSLS
uniref:SKA complex subunit 2 n=1 Tax=Monopterus albus TaxID=43700 RepID=UPI0009B4414A|nr:spindle and kinetochore-associated protein 2 [Monopterus albus]